METILAALVFIPLSFIIVDASFWAPMPARTSLSNLEELVRLDNVKQQSYPQKNIDNQGTAKYLPYSNPIRNYANVQYFTDVNIGNPPQTFRAIIDISWSDLFVFSSECQDELCQGHYRYNSSWSSTYKEDGTECRSNYTYYKGQGFLSRDTLYVAGLEITNQPFQELQHVWAQPEFLFSGDFDAVLGLAPANAFFDAKIPNLFQSMVSQGKLDRNVISIALGGTIWGDSYPGEITYGGINPNYFIGDLTYIPLSNVSDPYRPDDPCKDCKPLLNGTWRVEARGVSWGNGIDEYESLSGYTARFDTSDPFIYLPLEITKSLRDIFRPTLIPWYLETINCDNREWLPKLTFQLGGQNFTISAYEYTIEMKFGEFGYKCVNAIRPSRHQQGDDRDMIILGSAFLRGFYSVFDYDQQRVGFALAKYTADPYK